MNHFSAGQTFRSCLKIDRALIERFADLSGDRNPIHLDSAAAQSYGYPKQIAHGAILVAALSKVIGMEVPGSGAVWMSQSVEWKEPVLEGDEIELIITIKKYSASLKILVLDIVAINVKGNTVMKGNAQVKIAEKVQGELNVKKKNRQTVLITGSSRGIGAAIAKKLAGQGYVIGINYCNSKDEAEKIAADIIHGGGLAHVYRADLSNSKETEEMIQAATNDMGAIDVIVHGASPLFSDTKIEQVTYAHIEPFLKTYLGGAIVLVQKIAPAMAEQKFGRFIFLGTSFLFGQPPSGFAAYVSAKEALWGYVKSLAAELGPYGITSNMVSPSMAITDFTTHVPTRIKELEARKSPMRRLVSLADIAEQVSFIASPAAGYVNGANIPLTGGPV